MLRCLLNCVLNNKEQSLPLLLNSILLNRFKALIFVILLNLAGLFSYKSIAQQFALSGKVLDSANVGLQNVNILAFPIAEGEIKFAISNYEGAYKLKLKKNTTYRLEVSYLGFKKYVDSLTLVQDLIRDIALQRSDISLEEIILTERTPVRIKGDTTTYRPEKFNTGKERKLRDVLKNLPGVAVDRQGNVEAHGEPITKLLVDGKEFFTGDEKLGVNNIPADVIDEVEVIDNYTSVSFLKGLSDTDQKALNIKLKANKKKFAFGDINIGAGSEERYMVNPTLFYYSPKTSVNVIGDFNNVGKKSFTTSDYVNFEGGFSRLSADFSSLFRLYNDDFAKYLSTSDFVFNRNDFGALSVNQKITQNIGLNAYTIWSDGSLETQEQKTITYQVEDNLSENRTVANSSRAGFSINKLNVGYQGRKSLDIQYDVSLKTNQGDREGAINSRVSETASFIDQLNQTSSLDLTQKLAYNKRFSRKHTLSAHGSFKYVSASDDNQWDFNAPVFADLIPLDTSGQSILLTSAISNRLSQLKINIKHYWTFHRFHHIYPEVGVNVLGQDFNTVDAQHLENGGTNNFEASGFNNKTDFRLTEKYAGFYYKAKIGDFVLKPSLFVSTYNWIIRQQLTPENKRAKTVFLPAFNLRWEFRDHKITLDYKRNSNFANAKQLSNRLRLVGFNSLVAGNQDLENQIFQNFSMRYRRFSLFEGVILSAKTSYTHREKSIRNSVEIDGVNQINTLIYTDLPEDNYASFFSYTKLLNRMRLVGSVNASYSVYKRRVNGVFLNYQNTNWGGDLQVITNFKGNRPNVEMALAYRVNEISGNGFKSKFSTFKPSVLFEVPLFDDFMFTLNYGLTLFMNASQNESNYFQEAEASLLYHKESSPWSFGVDVTNLFNIDFRNEGSSSQFVVNDSRIFLQPRTVLFKISYKY